MMRRRLTAILAADVVGYSRLMGADEAGTLAALEELRTNVIEPKINQHEGHTVKLTGDGMLVEFPSVVNAVACAVAIQSEIRERNANETPNRRLELRVGVNLGDVISERDDIFGDGVNVAARLEGIAPPGGIAVSESVRDHVGNRLSIDFADRGEPELKNIEKPVRVYDVVLPSQEPDETMFAEKKEKSSIAVCHSPI
jgi:adenylate cyclase